MNQAATGTPIECPTPRTAALTLAMVLTLGFPASGEDWTRIAAETDEPGFAMRVFSVVPGSQAEAIGLETGDYVYQIGASCTAALSGSQRTQDESLFFCRAGGQKGMVTIGPGRIGVEWATSFRPQLDYLRSDIGSADPAWDASAVAALALLETDPAGAVERWGEARALGYPDDELNAFVRAFCAWRLGRTIPVQEAFDAIHKEFSQMPHLYAAYLEDMAHASGRTDLLRKLHDLDPDSSRVSEAWLQNWEQFDASPPLDRRLLELAEQRRGRSLLDEISVPPLEDDPRMEGRLQLLRNLGSRSSDPGKYTETRFSLPDTKRDFHCSLALRLSVQEFHERWGSSIRLEALTDEASGERFGARRLAELTIIANKDGSTWIQSRGGHSEARRVLWLHDEPIPVVGERAGATAPEASREFRLDLVRLGREIAVYANGVAYTHLPFDPQVPTESLQFFASGVTVDFTDFQVWSLSDNP